MKNRVSLRKFCRLASSFLRNFIGKKNQSNGRNRIEKRCLKVNLDARIVIYVSILESLRIFMAKRLADPELRGWEVDQSLKKKSNWRKNVIEEKCLKMIFCTRIVIYVSSLVSLRNFMAKRLADPELRGWEVDHFFCIPWEHSETKLLVTRLKRVFKRKRSRLTSKSHTLNKMALSVFANSAKTSLR